MVYVTGDLHGSIDIAKLSFGCFPEQKSLTKQDYVIVCGDFGLVWDGGRSEKIWQAIVAEKPFTTLFVDGNHENFEMLDALPQVDMFGGKVHEVVPGIYHLIRGQVLTIDGKRIFVMGGASSHDKMFRKEHISWWKEELPTGAEIKAASDTLEANGWCVDYVISHCAPRSIQKEIAPDYEKDRLTTFFERLKNELTFRHWYFGHYHMDRQLGDKFTAIFNKAILLNDEKKSVMAER